MFVLVTGKPGSGKSAYAVDYMLKHKTDYYNIYANVNGLKMQDNIKPLNFNMLMAIVSDCKDIYEKQIDELGDNSKENIIDAPIIDYLLNVGFIVQNPNFIKYKEEKEKRKNLNSFVLYFLELRKPLKVESEFKSTLILIDEAQNHLPAIDRETGKAGKVDPVIAWWISYHRHLFMDVYLLSQNHKKIHSAYLRDVEYFLDAVPSSRTLFSSNFVYKHHTAIPYFKTNLAGKVNIKKRKEIFEAYDSGDKVRTKSVIVPYIIFALIFLAIGIALFNYVSYSLTSTNDKENIKEPNTQNISISEDKDKSKIIIKESADDAKYIKLFCKYDRCTNSKFNISFHIKDLQYLLKDTNSDYLHATSKGNNLAYVYLLVSPKFLGLFQSRSEHNDKNKKGFTIIN